MGYMLYQQERRGKIRSGSADTVTNESRHHWRYTITDSFDNCGVHDITQTNPSACASRLKHTHTLSHTQHTTHTYSRMARTCTSEGNEVQGVIVRVMRIQARNHEGMRQRRYAPPNTPGTCR